LSKNSSLVSDAHQPTLDRWPPTVRPGLPAGTRNAEISLSPVFAATVISDVMSVPALVMKALEPLITHSPPSCRAVVRIPPGTSVPPPGSVSPNAASCSPAHRAGSHWRFCSSVPNR
jgi:hypothetical protein